MTDDFAMYTHNQKALPAGFPKCSSLLADFPVVEAKESGKKKKSIVSNNIYLIGGDVARAFGI